MLFNYKNLLNFDGGHSTQHPVNAGVPQDKTITLKRLSNLPNLETRITEELKSLDININNCMYLNTVESIYVTLKLTWALSTL